METEHAELLRKILAEIKPPLHCEQYDRLYVAYLYVLRDVAGLHAKVSILPNDLNYGLGLDTDTNCDNLFRAQEQQRGGPLPSLNDTVGDISLSDTATAVVGHCNTLANGEIREAESRNAVEAACSTDSDGSKRATITSVKRRQKKRNRRKNVSVHNGQSTDPVSNIGISDSITGTHVGRLDTAPVQESVRVCNRPDCLISGSVLCARVSGRSWRRTEAETAERSDTFTGHLVHSAPRDNSMSSTWSRSTRSVESSEDNDTKIIAAKDIATESLWKKRHLENSVAIARMEAELSSEDETRKRDNSLRKNIDSLVRDNNALKKQIKEYRSDRVLLLQGIVSAKRGISN